MSDILSIGKLSVSAYQSALSVTSQNIANVSTAYYSRRIVNFAEAPFYNGVNVSNVDRVFSEASSIQLQNYNSLLANTTLYLTQIGALEQLLDNDQNSVATYINQTCETMRGLSTLADNVSSRSLYLQQLGIMTDSFNSVSNQLLLNQQNVNQSMQSIVEYVNQLTAEIATINQQIFNAVDQDISSLEDTREALLQDLAQYLDFQRNVDASGQVNVLLSDGTTLIAEGNTNQLVATMSQTNPSYLAIALQAGSTTIGIDNLITNGQLGALLQYRDNALIPTQYSIDRLALCIADQINQQNKLGMDLYGNLGIDIFSDINTPALINDRSIANLNNTGSEQMTVSITDTKLLTASDYSLQIVSPDNYVLTRNTDNVVVSSGALGAFPQEISVDGFTINLNSGAFNIGDQFLIIPTNNAAASIDVAITDPNLLALSYPVGVSTESRNGTIQVDDIIDTTTTAFSTPKALNPPIQIVFTSPTTYQIVNVDTSTVMEGPINYVPGGPIFPTPGGYDPGYAVSINGTIETNDTFNIFYKGTVSGGDISDNKNANKILALYDAQLVNGQSFVNNYDTTSLTVSNLTYRAETDYDSSFILQQAAVKTYGDSSGVSLDEEYINLARYQEAYQASAQIIDVAKSVFDTLIGIVRG